MALTEFQDKQIRLSVKTLAVWAIGIISIVSSFWIGYSNIMTELQDIKNTIAIQNIRIDNEVSRGGTVHGDFDKRISKLEGVK